MKSCILTKENLETLVRELAEFTKDRNYWLGISCGRIEHVEDPSHDWFRGVGTFERVVKLSFYENHNGYGIQIRHINSVDNLSVTPEDDIIFFGSEIIINGNDLLYFENNRNISPSGDTCLYMEWTVSRNEKYSSQKRQLTCSGN